LKLQNENPDLLVNNYLTTCLKENPYFKSFLISCELRRFF